MFEPTLSLDDSPTETAAWETSREFKPTEKRSWITPNWLGSMSDMSEKILYRATYEISD